MGFGKWWWWYCRLRGGFGGEGGWFGGLLTEVKDGSGQKVGVGLG